MPIPGAQFGGLLGDISLLRSIISGTDTYAMATLDAGFAARFVALTAQPVYSVRLYWVSPVTAGGTVKLQIETVDATTGKPTGTLYDANATISFTPVAGIQTYTFATPPTTNLTVGTAYAMTLLTTVAGTTQTLYVGSTSTLMLAGNPVTRLTTTTGSTPSSYAAQSNSIPICSLILGNGTEESMGMNPYAGSNTFLLYGNRASATKITLSQAMNVAGIEISGNCFVIIGTPATNADLVLFLQDSSGNTVTNSTITIDKDYITGSRQIRGLFSSVISLSAGTYRIVVYSPNSANSSNCHRLTSIGFINSGAVPNNFRLSTTTDVTTFASWSDSTTDNGVCALILDSFGTSGGMKVHPGMTGGLNG